MNSTPNRVRWLVFLLFIGGLAVLGAYVTASSAPAPSSPTQIFFTANRQGEIEPCGCQTGQVGGLTRMSAFLTQKKHAMGSATSIFWDSGDAFFALQGLKGSRLVQAKLKAQLIADSYRLMGLGYFTPGDRDFAAGLSFLRQLEKSSGATFLSANLSDKKGKLLFQPHATFMLGRLKVGVMGISSPEAFGEREELKVLDPKVAVEQGTRALREQGAKKIFVLSHGGLEFDRQVAKWGKVDWVFGAHSLDVTTSPLMESGARIVQPNLEGQQVGWITFPAPNSQEKNKPPFRYQLVELSPQWEAKNEVALKVEAYEKEIKKINASSARSHPQAPPKHPFVAQAQTCKSCHEPQYNFWKKTHHSSAYLVLFAKDQHFNPECIGCHSIGYRMEGAFEKIAHPTVLELGPGESIKSPLTGKNSELPIEGLMELVFLEELKKAPQKEVKPLDSRKEPQRYKQLHQRYHTTFETLFAQGKLKKTYQGVQCEHCHGSRVEHLEPPPKKGMKKKVSASACLECHRPPNDHDFDFKKMVHRVACPLMP